MADKQPDWEAIEASYRAGLLSIRAIAGQHGVAHNTIMKRAKKEGWQQDLTSKVKAAVRDKVTRAVTSNGDQSKVVTDAEIVDAKSTQGADVILSHMSGLARWRGIADKLCTALEDLPVVAENIGDFSRALNAGVDAQLKVIKGERQAYNLDTDEGSKTVNDLSDLMDELSKEA
ncbi:hypothetical protein D3C86_1323370 [compost metagenome]